MSTTPDIAIIGGSGFYQLHSEPTVSSADKSRVQEIATPYADESIRLTQDELNEHGVYFIPRHGRGHEIPPHKINYRANIWALRQAGVNKILAVNAVGGIHPDMQAGSLVIPDQLIDYTWGREHSFFDGLDSLHDHVDFTFPYDAELRESLIQSASTVNLSVFPQACFGCTQGPRLETAAEIRKLKQDGCDVVGMTGMPEAVLARELGIAYAAITLVVNPGAGLSDEIITIEKIKNVLSAGLQDVRVLLAEAIKLLV